MGKEVRGGLVYFFNSICLTRSFAFVWLGLALALAGCGGEQLADVSETDNAGGEQVCALDATESSANEMPTISMVAGNFGGPGTVDGLGDAARFFHPQGMVKDVLGNVYLAERDRIRKITPQGMVSTFVGGALGVSDGVGSAAEFLDARGIVFDGQGNMYVAELGGRRVRKVTPDGAVSTLSGSVFHSLPVDGSLEEARFQGVEALAIDGSGNLFVADYSAIRRITPDGVVTTWAGSTTEQGFENGFRVSARFNRVMALAFDSIGQLYVADLNTIRKISSSGVVTTLAGEGTDVWGGSVDGIGSSARFRSPQGLIVDDGGNVFVADTWNGLVRRVTPEGIVTTIARVGVQPRGIVLDDRGDLLVSLIQEHVVVKVTQDGSVVVFAGARSEPGGVDGVGAVARFQGITSLTADCDGNIYAADPNNKVIRKIAPGGSVTTFAGVIGLPGSDDGKGTSATFGFPVGVVADRSGNIYVTDSQNNNIRRVSSTGVVTTFAGVVGSPGASNGLLAMATFNSPMGVGLDGGGTLYVQDALGSSLRRILPIGEVESFAGLYADWGSADGQGVDARFGWSGDNYHNNIVIDRSGNIYISDTGNHTIRKVTPGGMVSTIAGVAGAAGYADGPAISAQFSSPSSLVVDAAGNLYVGDVGNNSVRKVTPSGTVSTVVGAPSSLGVSLGGYLPGSLSGVGAMVLVGRTLYIGTAYGVVAVNNLP